jgi:hypothetical protein
MDSIPDSATRFLEIEARQDEALQQLAELERRVEQVLAACLTAATRSAAGASNAAAETSTLASKAA